MANGEGGMERNGNGLPAYIIRSIGVFILGSSISSGIWLFNKLDDITQRLSVIETSVEKFHDSFYRWQAKHERVDEKQWEELNKIRRR